MSKLGITILFFLVLIVGLLLFQEDKPSKESTVTVTQEVMEDMQGVEAEEIAIENVIVQ
ncbi:MAG: hypothetical protein ACE5DQ_00310 [Candidatus Paceibacterota bacterium]